MRQIKITPQITDRSSICIEKYFTEVNKLDMITADQEVELVLRYKNQGDEQALNKLVSANLRFVISVAKQFQGYGIPLEDLINEGNIGLIKAAKKFDESKGFKFISYAVWWIRQSILASLSNNGRAIRIPTNKQNDWSKIQRKATEMEQHLGRKPTTEELSEELDMDEKLINDLFNQSKRILSMEAPSGDDDDITLGGTISNNSDEDTDHDVMNDSRKLDIINVLSKLNPNEKFVIEHYFGIDKDKRYELEEIGDLLGLSRERIRQIKDRALNKLKRSSVRNLLLSHLG
jgi:RNA polymerase primary sigma factor